MTIGGDAIGAQAIGGSDDDETPALVYEPVSRIMTAGLVSTRPAELVFLGAFLLWDNDDYIVFDNGDIISYG